MCFPSVYAFMSQHPLDWNGGLFTRCHGGYLSMRFSSFPMHEVTSDLSYSYQFFSRKVVTPCSGFMSGKVNHPSWNTPCISIALSSSNTKSTYSFWQDPQTSNFVPLRTQLLAASAAVGVSSTVTLYHTGSLSSESHIPKSPTGFQIEFWIDIPPVWEQIL